MCIDTFVGSHKPLPVIEFDKENPSFYIKEVDDVENSLAKKILKLSNIYFVGSFMGCSCGLSYGTWTEEEADHQNRIVDVKKMLTYLIDNSKDSILKLLYLDYDDLDRETKTKLFDPHEHLNAEEFDLESNVIFTIGPHTD